MSVARSSLAAKSSPHARRLALLIGAGVGSLIAGSLAAAWSLWYRTADFYCFWIGGRLVLAGRDPYDAPTWLAATAGVFPDPRGFLSPAPCADRFAYPYWTAVVLAPFGALPVEVAAMAWMSINVAAALAGALVAWRIAGGTERGRALFLALMLSSQPFWTLLVSGQFTGIMLGILASLAWALARDEERSAGVALAALLVKPQFGVLVGPAVVAHAALARHVRLLTAMAISAGVLAAVAFALAPSWAGGWVAELQLRQAGQLAVRPSVWGLSSFVFGDPAVGWLILAATIALIVFLARGDAFAPVPLVALTASLSLVISPYESIYDHLVLVLPWALALAIAVRRESISLQIALVAIASLLPWIVFAVWQRGGTATLGVLVPIAASLLLSFALRLERTS